MKEDIKKIFNELDTLLEENKKLKIELKKWKEWQPSDKDLIDLKKQAGDFSSRAANCVYTAALEKRIFDLEQMIKKSGLEIVDASRVDADGCGKPIVVRDGKMLSPKNEEARMKRETKLLQDHAKLKREYHELGEEKNKITAQYHMLNGRLKDDKK